MDLNKEQIAILNHSHANRAAGGYYCGDSPDMQALVAAGLMESAGRKSFVLDEYFRTTSKGREALRRANSVICVKNVEPPFSVDNQPRETVSL
jgi:hypothetical protein